jgi:hypothetical protein
MTAEPPMHINAGNFDVPVFEYLACSTDYFDVLNGERLHCGASYFDL